MADPKLLQVVAEALNLTPEAITPDADSNTVQAWDSLGHLEVILSVEQAFNVKFKISEVAKLVSVSQIEEALRRRKAL